MMYGILIYIYIYIYMWLSVVVVVVSPLGPELKGSVIRAALMLTLIDMCIVYSKQMNMC